MIFYYTISRINRDLYMLKAYMSYMRRDSFKYLTKCN